MDKTAICAVADFKFLRKYLKNFLYELREKGEFSDEVLIITSYFVPVSIIKIFIRDNNLIFLKKKKIKFSKKTNYILSNLDTGDQPNRHKTKRFQWHKLYLFSEEMKNWDFIFYLDINMHIHFPINNVLKNKPIGKFTARSDGYPDYKNNLQTQFDGFHKVNSELNKKYNLNNKYYFQTGVMFFDTKIIKQNTLDEIISLVEKYPISKTNEQGILNLYFLYEKNIFEELLMEIDDYLVYYYWLVSEKKIIITKQLREKYK